MNDRNEEPWLSAIKNDPRTEGQMRTDYANKLAELKEPRPVKAGTPLKADKIMTREEYLANPERCSLDAARQAIELAYGLLWIVGCDRSHKDGQSLYLARKALYERLDRDGQARGITAARDAIAGAPPLRDSRVDHGSQ